MAWVAVLLKARDVRSSDCGGIFVDRGRSEFHRIKAQSCEFRCCLGAYALALDRFNRSFLLHFSSCVNAIVIQSCLQQDRSCDGVELTVSTQAREVTELNSQLASSLNGGVEGYGGCLVSHRGC